MVKKSQYDGSVSNGMSVKTEDLDFDPWNLRGRLGETTAEVSSLTSTCAL